MFFWSWSYFAGRSGLGVVVRVFFCDFPFAALMVRYFLCCIYLICVVYLRYSFLGQVDGGCAPLNLHTWWGKSV